MRSRSARNDLSSPAKAKLGLARFCRDERGNIAVIFALGMPAVVVLAIGAVELFSLQSDRQKLQDVADLTALAAARELSFSPEQAVLARAEANALHQVASVAAKSEVKVDARTEKVGDQTIGVTVALNSHRMSFFGNLLPPGGFRLNVSATASGMNKAPLCVLGVSPTVPDGVNVDRGDLTAGGCVVHSNNNVRIGGASTLSAAVVQAVGAVTGAAGGAARTGAPPIDDPFAGLVTAPASWSSCLSEIRKADEDGEILELDPGVHCGHFDIDKTAILRLKPGLHYFRDKLQMKKDSRLEGEFATVVLGKDFELQIDDKNVRWNLLGAQTGTLAGFALVLDRARTAELKVPAEIIERLEGVAYAPTARLTVEGAADAAAESAWTVVVAEELRLRDDARMVINSNYAGSEVPVPAGVGEKASIGMGGNRLVD